MKPVLSILIISLFSAVTVNAQNLSHKLDLTTADTQCLNGNEFCFTDTITPKPGVPLKKAIYLFGDGSMQVFNPVLSPYVFICKTFDDPNGGSFNLTIEIHDSDDNIIKQTFLNLFTVRDCISSINEIKLENDNIIHFNPDNHTAWLWLNAEDKIELFDIQGRKMPFNFELSSGKIIIDLNELPKGLYTIVVYQSVQNKYITLKLVNP